RGSSARGRKRAPDQWLTKDGQEGGAGTGWVWRAATARLWRAATARERPAPAAPSRSRLATPANHRPVRFRTGAATGADYPRDPAQSASPLEPLPTDPDRRFASGVNLF